MFSVDPLPSQQCIIIGRGQRNVCFYTDTGLPSDSHSGLTPFIKVVTKRAMARCTIGQPKIRIWAAYSTIVVRTATHHRQTQTHAQVLYKV